MRVYVYEYEISLVGTNKIEHRIESFTDVNDFIARVKHYKDKYYISNEKCYVGEVKEINKEKVLNPF